MLVLLLAATMACPTPGSTQLAGLWESHETSAGGIGGALELRADGTFIQATTVIVNFTYEVAGDQISVRGVNEPPESEPMVVKVRFKKGAWTQTRADGTKVSKQRVGAAPQGAESVVGVWRSAFSGGATLFERYNADGTMQFRLPLRGVRGCYAIEDGHLTLTPEGGKAKSYGFESDGSGLKLQPGNGEEPQLLDTTRGGVWYLLEQSVPGQR